ncbi:B12-binding domain-containing radical SAM protein [Sorangium sp. So ce1504]|uniref:B12-binding domain-containing radical SAM protein n=1 Tax=Sorangium sp. So ce1504 TaxID=3133337 RepID=UPI003F5F0BD2
MKLVLIDLADDGYNAYPFGLYALKAYLRLHVARLTVEVRSFKCGAPLDDILAHIEGDQADIIGLSCFVWNEQKNLEIARRVRALSDSRFIILGGPQIEKGAAEVERLLIDGTVDAAVVGEGEIPLLHIVEGIARGGAVPSGIENVGVLAAGVVRWGGEPTYEKCIDYLPSPYADLDDLRQIVAATGVALYESARGCPYLCTFCDQGAKAFRSHSMERIKKDLSEIFALAPRKIVFLDSTFNVSPARTKEILRFIIAHGHELEIEAEVKPERCDQEMVELMRMAGIKSVELGLQSTKSQTLEFIKRRNNFERVAASVQMLIASGINVYIDTIIGLPGESLSDWLATIDYCFGLGDVAIFSSTLKILPNAELKRDIQGMGFTYDTARSCVIQRSDAMSAEDLELARLHQKMIKLFWNRSSDRAWLRQMIVEKLHGRLTLFTSELLQLLGAGTDPERLKSRQFWLDHAPLTTGAGRYVPPAPRGRHLKVLS